MARTKRNFSSSSFLLKGEREFQPQHRADETYIPPLHSKRLVIPVLFGTLHVHICIYTGLRHHARPSHRFSDLLRQICLRLQIVTTRFGFCESPPPTFPAVRVTSSSSSSSSSSCLVNRCVAVAKQSCRFRPLDNQTREEKQEDFIIVDNSKPKIRTTKTNFSSSPSSSSSSASFVLRLPCESLWSCRKTELSIYNSWQSKMAGKTTGFHYSRQLQVQNPQNQNKLFFFLCWFSDCLVNRCEAVAKQSRGFTGLDRLNTAGKRRGFHSSRQLQSQNLQNKNKLLFFSFSFSFCFVFFFSSPLPLSTAGRLLENKAVDFQLSTIRDGRKNKRISFFLLDNSKGQTCRETKQAPKKQKKKRKKGKKKLESRTSNALQPDKRERITYSKILPHKTRGNATKSATTRRTSRQAQEQNAPKFKQRRSARKPRVCGADEWMDDEFLSSIFRPLFPYLGRQVLS